MIWVCDVYTQSNERSTGLAERKPVPGIANSTSIVLFVLFIV